jgi:tyrosinase
MASTAYDGTSFEDQHNEIHVALGCVHPPGHMANLVYSGYDPVFMLHHAAIDRHVALWQAIHYNNTMFNTTYTSTVGAYATAAGTNITNDSPLKPFYADAKGTFQTSQSVKDVRDLGYTYPELLGENSMTKEKLRRRVIGVVNRLYGNSTTAGVQKRTEGGREGKEYFVKIRVDKGEIKDLPAILNILVGERLAGRFVLPQIPSHGVVYTEISLGHALEAAKLASLDTKTVIPFLEREMRWELKQARIPFHPCRVDFRLTGQ